MPYSDPEAQKNYMRAWRRQKRVWLWEFKKTEKCNRCGFANAAALQFHHTSGKDRDISKMVTRNCSWAKILAEIKRCEVLCANCHAIEHNSRFAP